MSLKKVCGENGREAQRRNIDAVLMNESCTGNKLPGMDFGFVPFTPEERDAFLSDAGENYDVERFIREEVLS